MTDALIIICSTPYSKRLPEKCFIDINGKPALQHILDRIDSLDIPLMLAIPNDCWEIYTDKIGIENKTFIWTGNIESPLHRMAAAIINFQESHHKIDYIVRITHDDILIDPQTIKDLLDKARTEKAGYAITPDIVEGAGVEVIAVENLLKAAEDHKEPIEHVSYFVKGEGCPNSKIIKVYPRKEVIRDYRLTLDYYEDYVALEAILKTLGNNASVDEICQFLDMNPGILNYNKLPLVTIYTCVKNAEKWINETIRSIKSAIDYTKNAEYILIDDNSIDNTLLKAITLVVPELKIYVNNDGIGLASSSNKAMDMARGQYIMRVDGDDLIQRDIILKMADRMIRDQSVICYSNYNEINGENRTIRQNIEAKDKHHAGCALMDKRWLNQIRFKEGIKHWDSLELYNRIKDKFPISYIDEPLWYYRNHPDSMSRNNLAERKELRKKFDAR